MLAVARTISAETRKPRIVILLDMVWCSIVYQAGYLDYEEFEFYLLTPRQRATWITSGNANSIVVKYNQRSYRQKFSDKSQFNRIFADYLGRDWIDIREHTTSEVRDFVVAHGTVMLKVVDGVSGRGIEKRTAADIVDFPAFRDELLASGQYLIEELITQHPAMATLCPTSVNSLRVITFFDGSTVHVLEAVLRMGNGADVDNYGRGGMYTVLDEHGVARYPAFDNQSRTFDVHPLTGTRIVGFQVPLYEQMVAVLDSAARVVPEIPYVGWDVAIARDSIVVIEGNYNTGVFQMKPSLTGIKTGLLQHFRSVIDF